MSRKPAASSAQVTPFDLVAASSHLAILAGEPDPVMDFRLIPESAAAWAALNALPREDRVKVRMKYRGRLSDLAAVFKQKNEAGYAIFALPAETDGKGQKKGNLKASRA